MAVAYHPASDCLEAVILSQGNGCGDDRILADCDDSESIDPDVLRAAAVEAENSREADENANPASWTKWWSIANHMRLQADYIELRDKGDVNRD